jgi:hypothetical protein
MEVVSKEASKPEFESLKRPKIIISEDVILISDPPFAWRILMIFFCLFLTWIGLQFKQGNDKVMGIVVSLSCALAFIYDALSLQRVKIDLQEKIVYRTSLNPLENLVNRLLHRPAKLPFNKIEKIYSDYNVAVGAATQRYYVYIRSDNHYKLNIGTFNKEADAAHFATYLDKKIR